MYYPIHNNNGSFVNEKSLLWVASFQLLITRQLKLEQACFDPMWYVNRVILNSKKSIYIEKAFAATVTIYALISMLMLLVHL